MKKLNKLSLVAIYGPAGSGKTTCADLLRAELVDTAHIGVDHIKRLISEFRNVRNQPLYQEISKKVINAMVVEYLKNNINVIVEQGMTYAEIETLKKIAFENDADFFVYRLDASREAADMRAEKRHKELNKPPIPKEILGSLYKTYQENNYSNTKAFNTEELDTKEIVNRILGDLK